MAAKHALGWSEIASRRVAGESAESERELVDIGEGRTVDHSGEPLDPADAGAVPNLAESHDPAS